MTVDVQTEIEIDRPRGEVAAYDPDNATEWYENIKSVEWMSPKPVAAGSRIRFVAQFLGRRLDYIYEVTAIVLDERFVMTTLEGPFPMETMYSWQDTLSGGTKMGLRNRASRPASQGLPRR